MFSVAYLEDEKSEIPRTAYKRNRTVTDNTTVQTISTRQDRKMGKCPQAATSRVGLAGNTQPNALTAPKVCLRVGKAQKQHARVPMAP